ncbi:unnamed protein product [Cylicocyclus nassatus]|uniref:Uncharacterized protein n=1 Tax=Cylicocyclus nassatus TaxID=53992 RepID=A0AA36DSH9_CYLNA|nr:unnamed protein product [Cylicocyclus nassatus]
MPNWFNRPLQMPRVKHSTFDLSNDLKTSMRGGFLTPVGVEEIIPSDKLLKHNTEVSLVTGTKVNPFINGIFDYLGYDVYGLCDTTQDDEDIWIHKMMIDNPLPFLSYLCIVRDWYCDSNLQKATMNDIDEIIELYRVACAEGHYLPSSEWLPDGQEAKIQLFNVAYTKDYFNTARPEPQNGSSNDASVLVEHNTGNLFANYSSYPKLNETTTVRDLWKKEMMQRYFETDNTFGTRIREKLAGHYGVRYSDQRIQIPMFCGGSSSYTQISEVLSNSNATDVQGNSGLGDFAGKGIAVDNAHSRTEFFEEHGYYMTLLSVIPDNGYCRGMQRSFFKKNIFDFASPEFNNIGWQDVLNESCFAMALTIKIRPDNVIKNCRGKKATAGMSDRELNLYFAWKEQQEKWYEGYRSWYDSNYNQHYNSEAERLKRLQAIGQNPFYTEGIGNDANLSSFNNPEAPAYNSEQGSMMNVINSVLQGTMQIASFANNLQSSEVDRELVRQKAISQGLENSKQMYLLGFGYDYNNGEVNKYSSHAIGLPENSRNGKAFFKMQDTIPYWADTPFAHLTSGQIANLQSSGDLRNYQLNNIMPSLANLYRMQSALSGLPADKQKNLKKRQNYRQSKGDRFMLAAAFNKKNGGRNFFLTLTYNDEALCWALPPNKHSGEWYPCFEPKHLKNLFKYLRDDRGYHFRYFVCCLCNDEGKRYKWDVRKPWTRISNGFGIDAIPYLNEYIHNDGNIRDKCPLVTGTKVNPFINGIFDYLGYDVYGLCDTTQDDEDIWIHKMMIDNPLPFLSYLCIVRDWYCDSNLQKATMNDIDEIIELYRVACAEGHYLPSSEWLPDGQEAKIQLFNVAYTKDYFNTARPEPQNGPQMYVLNRPFFG